jgi:lipopolysaccharide/colanic/teichoic acid biosynthesis glycosyltransferase
MIVGGSNARIHVGLPTRPTETAIEPPTHWSEVPVRSWYQRRGKRLFDVVVGALLLVAALPLLALVAVVVAVSMGRPVVYVQHRPGYHGRPFRIYKFRTMRHDRRSTRAHFDGQDRRRTWKTTDDPRHTAIGRLLRATSLDELPQLYNVLRGDMALVGPRPEILDAAVANGILDHPRHAYRPGITGPWQVEDRSQGELGVKLAHDVAYVASVSFRTDLGLLLRTPLAVLTRPGE